MIKINSKNFQSPKINSIKKKEGKRDEHLYIAGYPSACSNARHVYIEDGHMDSYLTKSHVIPQTFT